MADEPKKGIDFKHPGGKEALLAGGVALALALIYFYVKNRQAANQTAAQQSAAASSNSPTALFASFLHDFQSSSSGGTTVTVPDVVGMSDAAADAAISAAGLKVSDSNEPKGGFGKVKATVKSQSPAAGAKVKPGSMVTLTFNIPAKKTSGGGGDSGEG